MNKKTLATITVPLLATAAITQPLLSATAITQPLLSEEELKMIAASQVPGDSSLGVWQCEPPENGC